MKNMMELAKPFKDEFGNSNHLKVVATIDFLPIDYIGSEEGRYVFHVTERCMIASKQFHTYLDAMNHAFLIYGESIQTVIFRSDELLICKWRVQ